MAFMPHFKKFREAHLRHRRAQRFQPFDRLAAAVAAHGILGNQAGDGTSMPGKDDGLPALDVIEELGKVDFRFRSLNLAHGIDQLF